MELIYHPSESAVRPPEIEVGVTTAYLRRNIVETQRNEPDGEAVTMFVYEEAAAPKDEYLTLMARRQEEHARALADADGINVDQEYRLTLLELGLSETDI